MLRPAIFEPTGPLFFDRVFRDFFRNDFRQLDRDNFSTDVINNGDNYLLQAELPGYNKEEIKVNLDNETLTITASHNEEKKKSKDNYIRQERSYHSYCRSFHIPGIKKDEISAAYKDGVLEITLPKDDDKVKANKQIEIK